jgi:hypothetical protein
VESPNFFDSRGDKDRSRSLSLIRKYLLTSFCDFSRYEDNLQEGCRGYELEESRGCEHEGSLDYVTNGEQEWERIWDGFPGWV